MVAQRKYLFVASFAGRYTDRMATIAEAEELALSLTESERAQLAERLLSSLPGVLVDEDGGIAEALRRDKEMDSDPQKIISHDDFLGFFQDRAQ